MPEEQEITKAGGRPHPTLLNFPDRAAYGANQPAISEHGKSRIPVPQAVKVQLGQIQVLQGLPAKWQNGSLAADENGTTGAQGGTNLSPQVHRTSNLVSKTNCRGPVTTRKKHCPLRTSMKPLSEEQQPLSAVRCVFETDRTP